MDRFLEESVSKHHRAAEEVLYYACLLYTSHFLREIMCFCAQEFGLKLGGAFRYGAEEG